MIPCKCVQFNLLLGSCTTRSKPCSQLTRIYTMDTDQSQLNTNYSTYTSTTSVYPVPGPSASKKVCPPSNPTNIADLEAGTMHTTHSTPTTHTTSNLSNQPFSYPLSEPDEITQIIEKNVRLRFIRKIYTLLCIQLLTTLIMSVGVAYTPSAQQFIVHHTGLFYGAIIMTFVFLFASFAWGRQHPHGLLILAGFTLCESYTISTLSCIYDAQSIILAWGLTFTVFLSLTIYVHYTKKDFQYLGAALMSSLMILILAGLFQLFFSTGPILNTAISAFGAMVAVGYILYDTSDIVHRLTPDDYIYACISLYLDVIMLFVRLLELTNRD